MRDDSTIQALMNEDRCDLDRVIALSKLYRALTDKEKAVFRTQETLFTLSEVLR